MFKTTLAQSNWESKYQFGKETPIQTFERIARSLARHERPETIGFWEKEFLRIMVRFKDAVLGMSWSELADKAFSREFNPHNWAQHIDVQAAGLKCTPGGRITSNAGTGFGGATLLNCFINGPVTNATIAYLRKIPGTDKVVDNTIVTQDTPDSLANIFLTILEQAETLKSEGGYGINFGFIRPRGSAIGGIGIRHPGVVSYMGIWDKVSEVIVKGDNDGYVDTLRNHLLAAEDENELRQAKMIMKKMPRKGAMMACLPVSHPDIEEFIRAKQKKGVLTKFNISVVVSDAFLEAVEARQMFDLTFGGVVYKRVFAPDLYKLIMESTYNRAEPGVLFEDSMQRNNPLAYLGTVNATNPCFMPGTKVLVKDLGGTNWRKESIEDLVGKVVEVWTGTQWQVVDSFRVTGEDQEVFDVLLSTGHTVTATAEHRFILEDGTRRALKDLKEGDVLSHCGLEGVDHQIFTVIQVWSAGVAEKVYCCTVAGSHTFALANGLLTGNCGEIPGNPYISTVCLLGNINLTQYVYIDEPSRKRCFDYDQFIYDIYVFQRMLDNVCDEAHVPLPQYEWALKNIRQTGMGLNGMASAMYMLGIQYDSPEGIAFADKLAWLKEEHTWRASALLAKEKGAFPAYTEQFLETEWFLTFTTISDEAKGMIRAYGVRNGKTTTNAPNGNTSVLCDLVSNGIEPVFDHGYMRTVVATTWPNGLTIDNVRDILKEKLVGDAIVWEGEYQGRIWYFEPHNRGLCFLEEVADFGFVWVKENFPDDITGLHEFAVNPDEPLEISVKIHKRGKPSAYLVTAQQMKVEDHVAMQAVIQRHCNQSVSKTANIPNDYPFEAFMELYLKAWRAGLLGFTTYRAGTMENVIATLDKAEADEMPREVLQHGLVLPEEFLNGVGKTWKREGRKFYSHFSYHPSDSDMRHPVALWLVTNQDGADLVAVKRAIKKMEDLLSFYGIEQRLIDDQLERLKGKPSHEQLSRMVGMCLRHNLPLPNIVMTLESIEGDFISSALTAVRKMLSEKIGDGTRIEGKECPQCHSSNLVFESGCSKCRDCGASNCG